MYQQQGHSPSTFYMNILNRAVLIQLISLETKLYTYYNIKLKGVSSRRHRSHSYWHTSLGPYLRPPSSGCVCDPFQGGPFHIFGCFRKSVGWRRWASAFLFLSSTSSKILAEISKISHLVNRVLIVGVRDKPGLVLGLLLKLPLALRVTGWRDAIVPRRLEPPAYFVRQLP